MIIKSFVVDTVIPNLIDISNTTQHAYDLQRHNVVDYHLVAYSSKPLLR